MQFRRIVLTSLVVLGCGSSGAVDAALHSDLPTLRSSIGKERQSGALDRGRVTRIAEAVASREVYAGSGPAASARIRGLRACTQPLLPVIAERAERPDEAGAEATLVLLETGRISAASLVARHAESDSGAWRAVAARAATAPEHFRLRRRFYLDPDERVRRRALEAARQAPAALDLDALREAARLDPDPMSQSLAVRAIGALGGEAAVRALSDLWERAEDDARLAILDAWSIRPSFKAGGRAELLRVAETARGMPAVSAALILLRVDSSSTGLATTLLTRTVTEGPSDEQLLAIGAVPLDSTALDAVRKAAKDADPGVRIAALERLLEVQGERARTLAALRDEAKPTAAAPDTARTALARAGDTSVAPELKKALASKDGQRRTEAGMSLLALGDYANAATLLGDGEASVRLAIACRILAGG
ncbi:MAG TPA: hypothetical protein VGK73_23260 [Polyangiaceae bacterium]